MNDPVAVAVGNPVAVITADPDNVEQQQTWAKWNPEVLKNNQSAELTTFLFIKKTLRSL